MFALLAGALALTIASGNDDALRAQFYSDVAAKRYAQALHDGRPYVDAHPDDAQFALDYAYALCNAAQTAQARSLLEQLERSPNASIARAARSQLAALSPAVQAPAASIYVSGYVEPDGRYRDTFYGLQVRHDLRTGNVRPFVTADLTSDTRSGAPQTAQVFNTDTLFAGVGLRAMPAAGLEVRLMGGEGAGLRGQSTMAEIRAQASYWRAFGLGALHAQTSVGSTAFYGSRFGGNVMTYTSLQHDMPVARNVRFLIGVNAAADTRGLWYNNFVETLAGVQVRAAANTSLRFDLRHGKGYTAARALLSFSAGNP